MSAVPSDTPPPLGKSGGNAAEGVPHLSDVTTEGPSKVHYYSQQVRAGCEGGEKGFLLGGRGGLGFC